MTHTPLLRRGGARLLPSSALGLLLPLLLLTASASSHAELLAGVATADITPPLGGRMYGYGARGTNTSTGVHDPLFAKALVLDDGSEAIALVTVDLGSFGKPHATAVRKIVREKTGVKHVLVVASHTHSAPRFNPSFPSAERPWIKKMQGLVAGAVIAAHSSRVPARLGVGWGELNACHNRRQVEADGTVKMLWGNREGKPTSPVDKAVAVVAIDRVDGGALATVVNFACHPVVLGPENLQISADFPGAMASFVQQRLGGEVLFAQGAAGDLNPFWDKTAPADGGFEQMQELGHALGEEVVRVRQGVELLDTGTLSIEQQLISLEPRWDLESREVRAAFEENEFGWIFEAYRERFRRERQAEINTIVLGKQLAIATFPGEFFVEHQMRLRANSMIPTLFFGYCNGELGYFPTIRAAAEGGYGGKEATIVEVGAGEKLVDRALIRLHHQVGKLHAVPRFD